MLYQVARYIIATNFQAIIILGYKYTYCDSSAGTLTPLTYERISSTRLVYRESTYGATARTFVYCHSLSGKIFIFVRTYRSCIHHIVRAVFALNVY